MNYRYICTINKKGTVWFLSLVLQILIFLRCIEAGTRFEGVEVVMTDDEGIGVVDLQGAEQTQQCLLLCLGARVGRLTAGVESALVADAYRVGVVVLAVGTDEIFRSTCFYLSVTTDDVVVADAEVEAPLAMPCVYLCRRTRLVGSHCRAMNHD